SGDRHAQTATPTIRASGAGESGNPRSRENNPGGCSFPHQTRSSTWRVAEGRQPRRDQATMTEADFPAPDLTQLDAFLRERIQGQDFAASRVTSAVQRAELGLR